jgi:hypothetical protein
MPLIVYLFGSQFHLSSISDLGYNYSNYTTLAIFHKTNYKIGLLNFVFYRSPNPLQDEWSTLDVFS